MQLQTSMTEKVGAKTALIVGITFGSTTLTSSFSFFGIYGISSFQLTKRLNNVFIHSGGARILEQAGPAAGPKVLW